ncbi:efflux RND transporter permease subunit [Paraferrimonas sedimenticola]|uniref:Acriflavin resistance protein n=1 Tax=Paraferrimonas sedimenticola TaxID=375674 RepID=A0AA37RTS4_9GAMM|nr:efflux RND transporter permease subunit [Paraferrimonas sedimenticola]GLP95555.1 acriflavin resistance protein [Paraferrimonas sedimenticola]
MDTQKGIIAWFARNSVAANLLMIILLVGGLFGALTINKEVFPSFELNLVQVNVAYPGAAPQEIEEGINIKIEEQIKDIDGIKKMTSVAREGVGQVTVEVENEYSPKEVLDEMKLRIDAISTFPENIERPRIFRIKPKSNVLWMSVYGDLTRTEMKELGKQIRDEVTNLPGITNTDFWGARPYEIAIEVSEDRLREYGLSFEQVAQAVRASSLDLPGGSIKAQAGDILLRTKGQKYYGDDFAQVVVKTRPDGSRIMLPEVATIRDDFEEGLAYTRFNGEPAVTVQINSVDDQSALAISQTIKRYIEERRDTLPAGAELDIWLDLTHYLSGRLNMMLSNMAGGAILVFVVLALFLNVKLAFWVIVGLPVCFLGAVLIMPMSFMGLSINLLSLFGFILVLGIVVDDAIVIGESAYTAIEREGHSVDSVVRGTKRVAVPAIFGVLTTIAAFAPMVMVSGPMGSIWQSIGFVVILCLMFSIVESKLILPAHLSHMKLAKPKPFEEYNWFTQRKIMFNQAFNRFVQEKYRPFVSWCLNNRYTVLSSFIAVLILSVALVASGKVRWVFFPDIPQDFLQVRIEMDEGVSEQTTFNALRQVEDALYRMNDQMGQELPTEPVKHTFVNMSSRTSAFMFVELYKMEDLGVTGTQIANAWRDQLPELAGAKKVDIQSSGNQGGGAISFRLVSSDLEQLARAADELKRELRDYTGVFDISDNYSSGSDEIRLKILPQGEALGISLSDLAQQVRYAFYGFEAQRILRNKEEVKVMVRYPLEQRRTIGHLENMRIRTPQGQMVPFSYIAEIEQSESFSSITRVDGKRAITISANADKAVVEPSKVTKDILERVIPAMQERYPDVTSELDGSSADEATAMVALIQGAFFALFTIYALMAIPLKSYSQPLIIMSVIPFGIIGAVIGHLVRGLDVSILSLMGIVALAGVVVNDSLILVDFVNKARKQGMAIVDAAINAGCERFRAIILTSLTTFFGLVPIMFETSLQAQVVIPMATSLAFGIVFSTVVTLILIPVLYIALDDLKRLTRWWWRPNRESQQTVNQ